MESSGGVTASTDDLRARMRGLSGNEKQTRNHAGDDTQADEAKLGDTPPGISACGGSDLIRIDRWIAPSADTVIIPRGRVSPTGSNGGDRRAGNREHRADDVENPCPVTDRHDATLSTGMVTATQALRLPVLCPVQGRPQAGPSAHGATRR